ncbi:Chloramphenicol phosphotransferase-like protein [Mesorhizobium albiziae]|uniref:Chloramphenicol phosphotransferase-like protein n=1 Tax=Neomesorhizobium albiziae TaxID=335020 RepID=A0A1I4DIC4_9HYPH|nr:AAA family ATPase [Mesorhizobium albiziae]GLS32378.1 hypothetical protein GCM10007937_40880 [Mesorhizobium albiziae]SFK91816.1 Chloramphenicol phosphotransferase-like protein [Mesorhizobium albiziae]
MPADLSFPRIIVITGGMAAGKSTVVQALAERLPKSVHLRGDIFRKMVVGGRKEMSPDASPEALRQLELRYDLACHTALQYAAAGFHVVYQDVILGKYLARVVDRLKPCTTGVVVLDPSSTALASRDAARAKTAYGAWTSEAMRDLLHAQTPRIGFWVDTSSQTVGETVDAILANPESMRELDL